MKVIFVSDFFRTEVLGGAESNDSVLLHHLQEKKYDVEKINCVNLDNSYYNKTNFFIISNFTSLSEEHKLKIQKERYIIYEHDHKYLHTRDPSKFEDFVAPQSQIMNKIFYENAEAVVVLSSICKKVIEDNLNIDNVFNIGCSLWSKEKLSYIKSLSNNAKNGKFAILNSSNPIKNTKKSVEFCKSKNIPYELVDGCEERELLKRLSEYEGLVFFPGVLETFSRISAEAKMLNCKLLTKPKLLGFASEGIFTLSGDRLIDEISNRVEKALELFENLIHKKELKSEITVILNCYRRPQYLKEQIRLIKEQTIKPEQIWVWVNHHEDNESFDFSDLDVDRVIRSNFNWKFYGRFSIAMLADTEYVALFDDDTLPGNKWFENCIETMDIKDGIMGGAGVKLKGKQYREHTRFGWSSQNEEIVEVDLVGHAWFFRQSWLKYLWMEKPFTWENGEDIQFSYCCQKFGGIKTYCPPHPKDDFAKHSSLKGYEYGVDDKATSNSRNHSVFYQQRDACVANAIDNGWKTVEMRK
jgi:hypothetical protein